MTSRRFCWRVDWRLTALVLALLPVLVALGGWQLTRAEEKAQLQAAHDALRGTAPRELASLGDDVPDFTPVRIAGQFDNRHLFLLDNRISEGRYGFEIIAPFVSAAGERVLVNRGWIEADSGRRVLPAVPPVEGEVVVTGHVYREPAGVRWVDNMSEQGWPQLIQFPDIPELSARLEQPVRPFILRLDPHSTGALTVHWPVVNMSPATHVGYAVQWFGLAAALIVAWLLASTNVWDVLKGKR